MSEQQTESTPRRRRSQSDAEQAYDLRFVKRETGETHFNTATGSYEKITHAETGEPNAEYLLIASIDGVDVPLAHYNAGRVETIVRSQQQAEDQSGA